MNALNPLLGVTPSYGWLILWVLFSPVSVALAIYATIRVVRSGERTWVIVFWLLYIWLLPLLGSLAVLWAVRGAEVKR